MIRLGSPAIHRLRSALVPALLPLIYAVVFVAVMGIWMLFELPQPEKMYEIIVRLFDQHWFLTVAVAALLEGIIILTLYVPGSAIILLGVATARGDPLRASFVVLLASAMFIIAAQCNYAIGYFGLHGLLARLGGGRWLQRVHKWYKQKRLYVVPAAFIHPTIGGFMAVTCGMARLRWSRFVFISSVAIVCWNTVWGILAYRFAGVVREVATSPLIVLGALLVWFVVADGNALLRVRPKADAKSQGTVRM